MSKITLTCLFFISFMVSVAAQDVVVATPKWRPVYHFSSPSNWLNDPNGLVYLNGEYQLYFQHNPFENKWGHMSWGHATSKDLVHWKNLPVAIPEIITKDTTTWIYSGSAVFDKDNTSGFGINGKGPLVAIFTADQPNQKKESQFIAYSNDNGITFTQYAHNPVIDLNKKDFRDPNVFWYQPTKQWIMTVAMVNEHVVRFYGSKGLKDWVKLSDFGPAGNSTSAWECPSLLPLVVDNDPAKIKWVLFVSTWGGHSPLVQYFVGDFDGVSFKKDNDNQLLTVDYGDTFYASIAWRDAPNNKKILLGWLQNGKPETYPWKGQMSVPRDLSLRTTADGVRLFQAPSSVIGRSLPKLSSGNMISKKNISFNDKNIELSEKGKFDGNANWITAEFKLNSSKNIGFYLTEKKGTSKKVIVGYDAVKQVLYVDCTASEKENKSADNLIQTAPMKPVNGTIRLNILLDKSSLEVFGNNGEKVISTMIYPDTDATGLSVFSQGKSLIKGLKVWDLSKVNASHKAITY